MIDLEALEQLAGRGDTVVEVTPAWLRQVIGEIRAGREAQAELARVGQCFGMPQGEKI